MKQRTNPNRPRRVDVINNRDDKLCCMMAMNGKSNKAIFIETGLSGGQISYRLRNNNIKRSDFRDGTSDYSKAVDRITRDLAAQMLIRHIKNNVGK